MHKLLIGLSLVAAVPAVAPELVREAIRDNPLYYGSITAGLALLAGFTVQIHEKVEGRATWPQVGAAMLYSLLAGVLAYVAAAAQDYDAYIAYIIAIIGGMWGRESANTVRAWGFEIIRALASKIAGVPLQAQEPSRKDHPKPP